MRLWSAVTPMGSDDSPFGLPVRDTVSGFKGVVIGQARYMTSADQYLVQPPTDENGKWVEARWFDAARLETCEAEPRKVGFDWRE